MVSTGTIDHIPVEGIEVPEHEVDHNNLVNGEDYTGTGNTRNAKKDTTVKDLVFLPNIDIDPVS